MRILIVVPRQNRATGNWVTGCRFQNGLETHGHQVHLCDIPLDASVLEREVTGFAPDLVLLLHAYRTGLPWLEVVRRHPLPSLVVLTGTDVNHGIHDAVEGPVIEAVLKGAGAIAIQNPLTFATLGRERPELSARLSYLRPGIELGGAPYALRADHGIAEDYFLFLCPASLRPVKGVLELLGLFDPLAQQGRDFHLAFCGPSLDDDYCSRFLAALRIRPWASYLGVIPDAAMAAVLTQADVIVNNSVSEGLPNALLEAVVLGRPVLAHAIPGNAAVIEEGVNGLLYAGAGQFLQQAGRLMDDAGLRRKLSQPAPERYRPDHEAAELDRLCRMLYRPS